ncbi:4-hydroxyphenylpyruvate dioxygenase [Thermocoleostomius sinensis]|uniref:4-hydroxyphenylpyruvate dioxygenase n=1 Tax=Thermocoleostomius sinensis A174 TaxID=2016057 RepID=A0A9E9C8R8_9CYAN|nr:4-hydroxyphenylpyruvate dioxygenase [Thermocoleostomius sinensis]WAL61699.1 4-hydroxyphenylpyruvate dioxygenase [Thermocoleostomius sinensis A174]
MMACNQHNLNTINAISIDHVHFYVEDAEAWRRWFVQVLGFQWVGRWMRSDTHTEIVESGDISFRLSAPLTANSAVANYLQQHPPGVANVAFRVADLNTVLQAAQAIGALVSSVSDSGGQRSVQIRGWGDLLHTVIEATSATAASPNSKAGMVQPFTTIDHVVLNVGVGELDAALTYYESLFGFQRQQNFAIRTDRSALCSQVLAHPNARIQFPINEPGSPSSQIQEFLDLNQGAGIQHIALQTQNILQTIAQLRNQGLSCLSVPVSYYEQLRQRPGFSLSPEEWQAVMTQEVLVDWPANIPQALLLQTFTQPIFQQPTFFFELIERRLYRDHDRYQQTQGFGEGNFQALFEAIEREQMKRGKL